MATVVEDVVGVPVMVKTKTIIATAWVQEIPKHPITTKSGTNKTRQMAPNLQLTGVIEEACHRCGTNGHWARVCRTPKHLVDIYQASIKGKEKKAWKTIMDALVLGENDEDICLADSATTHTILRDKKYF
ncbi:unnamed protein product [Prunus armeniaca]